MLIKTVLSVTVFAVAAGFTAHHFGTQDLKPQDAGKQPSMQDQEKMIAEYERAGTPGAEHKKLGTLAGSWETTTTSMGMGGPPETTKGTAENRAVRGGRHLVSDTTGMMMNKPYNASWIIGYDNTLKKYVSVWMDSMSTGIYPADGTADASGNVITFSGNMKDAMTPEGRPFKVVCTINDADKYTVEIYDSFDGKTETKVMTSVATRKK